jgi:hypothetical protein
LTIHYFTTHHSLLTTHLVVLLLVGIGLLLLILLSLVLVGLLVLRTIRIGLLLPVRLVVIVTTFCVVNGLVALKFQIAYFGLSFRTHHTLIVSCFLDLVFIVGTDTLYFHIEAIAAAGTAGSVTIRIIAIIRQTPWIITVSQAESNAIPKTVSIIRRITAYYHARTIVHVTTSIVMSATSYMSSPLGRCSKGQSQ